MKTGVITFHFANNFGAALQTYALTKTIKEQTGSDVKVIDYRNPFICFTDTIRMFPISKKPKEIISGIKTWKERRQRVQKFRLFHDRYYDLSEKYCSYGKLKRRPPKYDAFVCGSDQIWNPMVTLSVDKAYFLEFVNEENIKISYAASLGTENINEKHKKVMQKYLKSFNAVSVRESQNIAQIEDDTDFTVEHLIDPVFLREETEWSKMAGEPIVNGEYILVYVMQSNDEVYKYAKKVKELLHIPMVIISRYGYKVECADTILVDVGPEDFLSLFKHATYVCTNSFHGLAFSIIFEKNFFVVPSNRFNSRIDNLLNVLQLEKAKDIDEMSVQGRMYDVEKVRELILEERKKSFGYLKKHLS